MKNINNTGTILLYEKEEYLNQKVVTFLESKLFRVFSAVNYNDASEQFNRHKDEFSLIIVGTELINGDIETDFITRIRDENINLPIFVLISYISEDFTSNIFELDIDGYTLKPFAMDLFLYEIKKVMVLEGKAKSIERTISFSPEHFGAGTSILQYFGKLLQEKYPNENVSVAIKQEGLKVSMIIETPDGKKEETEKYLNRFGMVVTNQITPEEFTSNPIQLLELETKLKSAEMEIGFQKKLLALQDKTYDENLVSLKDEVKYLRDELSALRVSNNDNIQLLLSSLHLKDKTIKKLIKAIENKNQYETKSVLLELKEKDSQGYVSLKQHIDNAIIGGVVNAPSWIQFIINYLPK